MTEQFLRTGLPDSCFKKSVAKELFVCKKRFKSPAFQNIGLPNHDHVSTVENSADNNPIHTTHGRCVHTCMLSNPLLQNIRRLPDLLNCRISSKVKLA